MTTSTSRAVPSRHRSAAGTRRRKPVRRGRLALAISLSLLLLAAAGAGWVYLKLDGDIKTFDAGGLSDNRPAEGSSKGENVLVIGSDARNDGNAALGGGDVNDIGRSDT